MQITRQLLEAQRAHAVSERDNLLSKANAQIGAINVFDHLIAVLDQPEPPTPASPPTVAAPRTTGPVPPA